MGIPRHFVRAAGLCHPAHLQSSMSVHDATVDLSLHVSGQMLEQRQLSQRL